MKIKCYLCGSKKTYRISEIEEYFLYRCNKCKVVFVKPQPDPQRLKSNNSDKYNSEINETVYLNMQSIFTDRAKNCITILTKFNRKGKLLDIGCSYGFYLKAFELAGYKSTGLEISEKAVKYARNKLNLNIISDTFENHRFNDAEFDIVTLFDVLEHFPDPQKSIAKIRKILKKDGIIVVQTPNYDSLISKLTSTKWYWLLVPQHLFLYSINTLRFFLKNNGFKILHISTWDDHHEFVSNILSLIGINYWGKTSLLHRFLVKFKYALVPLSYLWNIFFLGGEIIVYAQKE